MKQSACYFFLFAALFFVLPTFSFAETPASTQSQTDSERYHQVQDLINQRHFDEARHILEKISASGVVDAQWHAAMGLVEEKSGHLENAREYYRQAVEQEPNDSTYLAVLGLNEIALGNSEKGIELLNQSSRLSPNGATYLALGAIYEQAGRKPLAIANYRLALAKFESEDDSEGIKEVQAAYQRLSYKEPWALKDFGVSLERFFETFQVILLYGVIPVVILFAGGWRQLRESMSGVRLTSLSIVGFLLTTSMTMGCYFSLTDAYHLRRDLLLPWWGFIVLALINVVIWILMRSILNKTMRWQTYGWTLLFVLVTSGICLWLGIGAYHMAREGTEGWGSAAGMIGLLQYFMMIFDIIVMIDALILVFGIGVITIFSYQRLRAEK